ncbi:MAG: hypothetical protein IJT51_04465 [Bacteroidales bacterium]|nr:hypothetical protein [Bacteroidales bacterium]
MGSEPNINQDFENDYMICGLCHWYREEHKTCMFGGGWGHYPEPDSLCERRDKADIIEELEERGISTVRIQNFQ